MIFGFSTEQRLCHFAGETPSEAPKDPQRQFADAKAAGKNITDKYATSDDKRTLERLQQYKQIERNLSERFANDASSTKADIVKELQQVVEELNDAVCNAPHARQLTRSNRFDTLEEGYVVSRENAAHLRYLENLRKDERQQRQERERIVREAEKKWNEDGAYWSSYGIISCYERPPQGSDTSVGGSAAFLTENVEMLKIVKGDVLDSFIQSIDKQIKQNGNLTQATRNRLEVLKRA